MPPNKQFQEFPVRYHFEIFYHPFVSEFIRRLNAGGIDGLLKWQVMQDGTESSVQQLPKLKDTSFRDYFPNPSAISGDYPEEKVDFSRGGAYSQYNWELFFHVPLLIAAQLSANQHFEEALAYLNYIFHPTDGSIQPGTQRFWKFWPFWNTAKNPAEAELQRLLTPDPNDPNKFKAARAELEQDIEAWRLSPFDPHLIARQRLWAYPKSVVMKYLDYVIAWADQLFQRDTLETINQATLLYILAAEILGPRPLETPPQDQPKVMTYAGLKHNLEQLSDTIVQNENLVFGLMTKDGNGGGKLPQILEFGIPRNQQLLGYWDTVADRLFKIRHCMNIEGVVQQLPLFEPPIDPALLVRAAAAGVDISSVLSDLYSPLPHYRFNTMLQKAIELCAEVKSLGAALLSVLEKRDAEALALLRSGHEIDLLAAVRLVKAKQVEEAQNNYDALTKSKDIIKARFDYYSKRVKVSPAEQSHLDAMSESLDLQQAEAIIESLVSGIHLIPDIKIGAPTSDGTTYGGSNIGASLQAFGSSFGTRAQASSTGGSISATNAGYDRRWDDWQLQASLAGGTDGKGGELAQIDKQLAAATLRWQIAQQELANHDKQTDNARAVDDFMRTKYTNQELYDWMLSQVSSLYFQSYQMAYNVAKRAEKSFQFERGDQKASFLHFGYWDSLQMGLHAGDRLHYDLRRMETAYLDQNKREYEISKHISLVLLDPIALIALRETGQCFVNLPEALFDMDYPGQYMRRIKSFTLTIPCVTGPYTSVNCTVTMLSNRIRFDSNASSTYQESDKGNDQRFVYNFAALQSIATSHGQNDSGIFELNFRDERYLPFEGAGAISYWRIDMPKENNAFDFETISDVIMNVNYTARDAGDLLRSLARSAAFLPPPPKPKPGPLAPDFVPQPTLLRMFSLKHEFSNEWYRFLHPADADPKQSLQFDLTQERFPFQFRGRNIQINQVDLFLKFKDINLDKNHTPLGDYAPNNSISKALWLYVTPPTIQESPGKLDSLRLGLPYASLTLNSPAPLTKVPGVDSWLLEAKDGVKDGDIGTIAETLRTGKISHHLSPEVIQDIMMVCHYSAL